MAKILVDAPAWVGDMVMAQVLFKLLKQRNPEVLIDAMAPAATAPLLECMPEIHQVLQTPFQHSELALKKRYQWAQSLKLQGYTQSIVLRNSYKSALIPFFARIPHRTGWLGEQRYGLLTDYRRLNKKNYPLMIQRFAALAFDKTAALPTILPEPGFTVSIDEKNACEKKFGLDLEKPVVVLCPGAEYGPSKRWPASHFAEVANVLMAEGYTVWLLGAKKDVLFAEEIQSLTQENCIDFIGRTSLLEAVHLLSFADFVVTNDSGLMHIAAALQKPLVAVFGSTSPAFTPPLCAQKILLETSLACRPCFQRECRFGHYHCLNQIAAQQVLEAIDTLTGNAPRGIVCN